MNSSLTSIELSKVLGLGQTFAFLKLYCLLLLNKQLNIKV